MMTDDRQFTKSLRVLCLYAIYIIRRHHSISSINFINNLMSRFIRSNRPFSELCIQQSTRIRVDCPRYDFVYYSIY